MGEVCIRGRLDQPGCRYLCERQGGERAGANWAQNVANYLGVSPSDSFAAQAGATGGTLTEPTTLEAAAASVNAALENATGDTLPEWIPYALGGAVLYLAFF